jgi:hypothetical protein
MVGQACLLGMLYIGIKNDEEVDNAPDMPANF